MIVFPNCKINIGLRILNKRTDGFHNIESIFLPVPLSDCLEVIEAKETGFNTAGMSIDGNASDNICLKAYRLLQTKFQLPPVSIFLYKNIPIGAGLGGGSSDGAFMLKLLNEKFSLQLSVDELKKMATELGSDCAFFIDNLSAHVTGRGEAMQSLTVNLKGKQLVLISTEVAVNTAWAYKELTAYRAQNLTAINNGPSFKETILLSVENWKQQFTNDFENPVFARYPQLLSIKQWLYACGAVYASMSGSGSSLFAIFNNPVNLEKDDKLQGITNIYKFII